MTVMDRRQAARTVTIAWAAVGGAIAIAALRDVNSDARALVGVATLLGIVTAVAASAALTHRRERVAGGLLVVSALVTPTFFAYALNLAPLLIGIVLIATPHALLHSGPVKLPSRDTP